MSETLTRAHEEFNSLPLQERIDTLDLSGRDLTLYEFFEWVSLRTSGDRHEHTKAAIVDYVEHVAQPYIEEMAERFRGG